MPSTAKSSLILLAVAIAVATPLSAQLTVGVVGGTVRYENVSTSSSLSLNPDLLVNRPHVLFDANASASDATDGTRVVQGGATLFGVTPPLAGPLQLTGLLQAQGIKPDGLPSSSSVLAFGEVAVAKAGGGFAAGIGGANGTLEGQSSVSALRTGARAWITVGPASLAVTAQPTRMTGTWFTDYGARVQAYQGPWILLGGATIRQGSGITTSAGMDAAAVWHPPGRVSVEMSGGRYLRDPYQALPAGWYLSAGLRFTLWTPPAVTGGASVRQASLTTLTIGGQSTLAGSTTRSVPSVTKSTGGTGTGTGSANTGRGHRP